VIEDLEAFDVDVTRALSLVITARRRVEDSIELVGRNDPMLLGRLRMARTALSGARRQLEACKEHALRAARR